MSSSKPAYALTEALSVFAMIMLYIWRLRWSYPLSWTIILALMLASHALRRETPAKLGFGLRNLADSLVRFTPVVLLLALMLLPAGSIARTIRHITPESGFASLLLYFGWGLFQQYAVNGFFVNRFMEFWPARAPLLAALLFSAAHAPNWCVV